MAKTRKVSGRKRISKQTRRVKQGGSIILNNSKKQVALGLKEALKKTKAKMEKGDYEGNVSYGAFGCGGVGQEQLVQYPLGKFDYRIPGIQSKIISYESENGDKFKKSLGRWMSGLASLELTQLFLDKIFEEGKAELPCKDIIPLLKRFEKLSS